MGMVRPMAKPSKKNLRFVHGGGQTVTQPNGVNKIGWKIDGMTNSKLEKVKE
jgi:hypothetical protein